MRNSLHQPIREQATDSRAAWFTVLEQSRRNGNERRAEVAIRNLRRLGVLVEYIERPRGAAHA